MREVSTSKTIGLFIHLLEQREISQDRIFEELNIDPKKINKSSYRIDWDVFISILERLENLVGLEGCEQAGTLIRGEEDIQYVSAASSLLRVMQLFASPERLYWVICHAAGPGIFHGVKFDLKIESNRRYTVKITLPEEKRFVEAFFHVYLGIFKALPSTIGLTDSVVSLSVHENIGTYSIYAPASRTLVSRMKSASAIFFGRSRIVESISSYEEEVMQALELARDFSDRAGLTAQQISNARMAALGSMASGIAHEINSPLTAILNSAERVKVEIKSGNLDQERMLRSAELITKSSRKIETVVRSLNRISGIGSGKGETTKLSELSTDLDKVFRQRLTDNQVDLKWEGFDPEVQLNLPESEAAQIFSSLIQNSIDAITSDASDSKPWIKISASCAEQLCRIILVDSGSIDGEVRDKIFDPFFSTKDLGEGRGLGLTTARSIAQQFDGTLEFDVTKKQTTFIVTLPVVNLEKS